MTDDELKAIEARVEGAHCSCAGSYRGCDLCGVAYEAFGDLLDEVRRLRGVLIAAECDRNVTVYTCERCKSVEIDTLSDWSGKANPK